MFNFLIIINDAAIISFFSFTSKKSANLILDWKFSEKDRIYFKSELLQNEVKTALTLVEVADKYDVEISVLGGGLTGQAGACRHAIARALVLSNETFKKEIKSFIGRMYAVGKVVVRLRNKLPSAHKMYTADCLGYFSLYLLRAGNISERALDQVVAIPYR